MNTAQSLLTLGALILASVVSLNFYRNNNGVTTSLDQDRFRIEAQSALISQVEQLSQYYFDEVTTDTSSSKRLADMTAPGSLGFEANDSSRIDDIDDLNGWSQNITGVSGVIYRVSSRVEYVTLTNSAFATSYIRQYSKRVTFSLVDTMTPPLLSHQQGNQIVRDTLRVSGVISYWFYN